MVGIEANARAWRLWDKNTKCIFVTGDTVFQENIFPATHHSSSPDVPSSFTCPIIFDELPSSSSNTDSPSSHTNLLQPSPNTPDLPASTTPQYLSINPAAPHQFPSPPPIAISNTEEPFEASDLTTPIVEPVVRRSPRVPTPVTKYGFAASTSHDSDHPTYSQAMSSPDKSAWLQAMQEEFDLINQHSVSTLVNPPPDANVIGGMWVFNKKCGQFNRLVLFKARWVVFGNHQIKGVDFTDTHSSVGMTDSLCILFAIFAALKIQICQFDVVTAFLNG